MSVTVVSGRSGSGKSRVLMKHIKEYIKDPFAKIIVIVPGQLTFETEKRIMKECEVAGILGLEVMSIQRLAFKVLEDTGNVSFISNAQKALYVSRALLSLNETFGDITDLEACAAQLISKLKSYGQTPESLRAASESISDAQLKQKLRKIAYLYEEYNSICKQPDLSDIYSLAAAAAARAEFLKGAHIVIDGLDSASPAVMRFLTEVIRQSGDTIAAFRSGSREEGDLFSSEEKDMKSFLEAARETGKDVKETTSSEPPRYGCDELAYLEANLFRYPYSPYTGDTSNITLFAAQSIEGEVDMIASGILEEVKQGRRFRDIAIAAGGMETYLPAIKTKFAQYGIPYFFDERRTLADNTFFTFLYDALCAAAGDVNAVESYVFSAYSPLDFEERTGLKAYAKAYALRGWHYSNPFYRGKGERAEALRQKALGPLQRLSKGLYGKTATEQIDQVKAFLSQCGAEKKLNAFCESIDSADTRLEHGYFTQVYEKSMEALDGVANAFEGENTEPRLLSRLLKVAFGTAKIALIPPSTDEVSIFDISVARLPDIDVLFAAGVHDGVWPAKDDGAGMVSRAERETLYNSGLDIGVYDASAEKLKVYTALSKPKQKLYISYNTQSGQPSVIVDRIKRLFPGIKAQTRAAYTSLKGAHERLLGDIAGTLGGAQAEESMTGVCSLFLKQTGWSEKAYRILLRTNAAVSISKGDAVSLYGGIRCSATRIEDYYRCPFKHFLDFGVKAQPERDYTNDRVDTGTYMHLALDIFVKKLLEDGEDIKEISAEETEMRMSDAARKAAELHEDSKLLTDERFRLRFELLRQELVNTALRIRGHFLGSGASIILSEQEFSGYKVDTEFGDIEINGKIDRIDAAGGFFRVVDYKSSSTDFSLKDFAGGVKIQLPVYISAAQKLMQAKRESLQAAGGYYMRIGDSYKGSEEEVAKEARLSGISLRDPEALLSLSALNADGSFAAIDQSLKISGELKGTIRNRHFAQDEMDRLLEYADMLIRNAAEHIYLGGNSINPALGISGGGACDYCEYGSVCLKDEGYEGNEARRIEGADSLFSGEEEGSADDME